MRVAVDIVIFAYQSQQLYFLGIKRKIDPFKGEWALPGGFVKDDEELEDAAFRELLEETGIKTSYLEQLYTFGKVDRDPRSRVITIAYMALLNHLPVTEASTDASDSKWLDAFAHPSLAFDHQAILKYAIERLRNKFEWTTAGFSLLPPTFPLSDLQKLYEIVLDKKLDKRNFRKKILSLGILKATGKKVANRVARPAELYRFSEKAYLKLKQKGLLFPF